MKVGIIGAGTMGQGIAQLCSAYNHDVILYDINRNTLKIALINIEQSLKLSVEKGKIHADEKQRCLNGIKTTTILNVVKADLIIEAATENLPIKQKIFQQLELFNHPKTIFTTNTSSLSIKEIGKLLTIKGRFAGIHFFNPAPQMKLVEIINTPDTDSSTIAFLKAFAIGLNKETVLAKDSPGFIVNRVARLFYLESLKILEESATTVTDIDSILSASGFKMGPFKLMDLIGIDTNHAVSKSIYAGFNNSNKFKPSAIQEEKVKRMELGLKTNIGFYDYKN
jgi:3-hydroxybutyryl-CoA dehydrogenase